MDSEENSSVSFIPEHLQKILSVIEGDETRHKWKLVRNATSFTLIINFPAKTTKGQVNHPQLKTRASGVSACQHQDKKNASSDVQLADQPKPKKKITTSCMARDRRRRREYWRRLKVARQLSRENLAAPYKKQGRLPDRTLLRWVSRRLLSAAWIVTPRKRGGLPVRRTSPVRNLGAWSVHP